MPFEVAPRNTQGLRSLRVTCQFLQRVGWLCDNYNKLTFGRGTSLSVTPSKSDHDSACGVGGGGAKGHQHGAQMAMQVA